MSAIQQLLLAGKTGRIPAMLMHLDGPNASTVFPDISGKSWAAAGNAKISTAQGQFGGASLLLDGSGDWIETSSNIASLVFGTNDFTIEGWFRTSQTSIRVMFDQWTQTIVGTWGVAMNASGNVYFFTSNGSLAMTVLTSSGAPINTGSWVHVAVCRKSGTLRIFINGVTRASAANTANYNGQSSRAALGAQVNTRNATYDWNGYIDEVRVINGVGIYDADFTVPSAPFPDTY